MGRSLGIPYLEVSAKTGKRLEDLFEHAIEDSVFTSSEEKMSVVEEGEEKKDGSTSGASNK